MEPIIVDLFCGGGGAGYGIFLATGKHADVAVNHSATAIAMYQANSPATTVLRQDIWSCPPRWACKGRPVALLHASPDCRHFSKAKGSAPNRDEKIRDLPWTIVKWAEEVRPTCITMENVEEIKTWGPLDKNGVPIKARAGETWKRFLHALRRLGYVVDSRELRACDYGAPTIRKRLFLVARCDGKRVVWPRPTHGDPKSEAVHKGKLAPWRTAAECIDFSLPCPSIFERSKPLAEATLHRIAEGIQRYVVQAERPFLVNLTHGGRLEDVDAPIKTITAAHRGEKALVAPSIVGIDQQGARSAVWGPEAPLSTIVTKAKHAMVAPVLAGCGGRAAQIPPRSPEVPFQTVTTKADTCLVSPLLVGAGGPAYGGKPVQADKPFGTLMTENHQALVAPVLCTNTTGHAASPADGQVPTLTTGQQQMLVAPTMVQTGYGERPGQAPRALDIEAPLGTAVAGGVKHAVVAAHMAKHYGGVVGQELDKPIGTVTTVDHHSLVATSMVKLRGTNVGSPAEEPLHTISAQGQHHGLVAAHLQRDFGKSVGHAADEPSGTVTAGGGGKSGLVASHLMKYYGEGGQHSSPAEPMHTIPTKHRMAVVEARELGWHAAEVRELLHWHRQSKLAWPLGRLDDLDGLLTDAFAGEVVIRGELYTIADIGLRMLQPRELYLAQGFPPAYIIGDDPAQGLALTKAEQVRMVGNSVSPDVEAAVVKANVDFGFVLDRGRDLPLLAGEAL